MNQIIQDQLSKLEIHDDTITEYLVTILDEPELLQEFIQELTPDSALASEITTEILAAHSNHDILPTVLASPPKDSTLDASLDQLSISEDDKLLSNDSATTIISPTEIQHVFLNSAPKKPTSKSNNYIIQSFAYDVDEIIQDANDSISINIKSNDAPLNLMQNSNKALVAEKERQKRQEAKLKHEKQVLLNKQSLEKQKLEQEKRKLKTTKREKTRM
jgi:hypothetical protein